MQEAPCAGEEYSKVRERNSKMTSLLKDRFFWYIFLLVIVIGGLANVIDLKTIGLLTPSEDWELAFLNVMLILFLATVAMATWRFGTKGGLFSYSAILVIAIPYILNSEISIWQPQTTIQIVTIMTTGLVFIWMIGRQKEVNELLEKTTIELRQQADQLNQEIIERKRAEAALHELDRMKSEFISSVSHELRTPLHSISGFTKLMLMEKAPNPKDQREFLTTIDKQAEHLAKLIDNLLDVSRLEAGRFDIQKQRISLKAAIHDAIKELYSLASEKGITISANTPANLSEVEADKERFMQAMGNLLGNAIKFSPNGGNIDVNMEVRKNEVLVSVTDHGIGIHKKDMPHIFDRFYRTKKSVFIGGTGLGLYITEQIIKAHGGHIWVESELGKGSTFHFTIPKS